MNALHLSPRALEQREFQLLPYLLRCRDIKDVTVAAPKLGLKQEALIEMLAAGFGPVPRPAFVNGGFWFHKGLISAFSSWVRKEASDEDLAAMAAIIRKYDTFNDHKHHDGSGDRAFVFGVMGIRS